jgi:ribosomal protein L31
MKTVKHPTAKRRLRVRVARPIPPLDGPQLRVAVCAACHPWWTGRQQRVEPRAGRKFRGRYAQHRAPRSIHAGLGVAPSSDTRDPESRARP